MYCTCKNKIVKIVPSFRNKIFLKICVLKQLVKCSPNPINYIKKSRRPPGAWPNWPRASCHLARILVWQCKTRGARIVCHAAFFDHLKTTLWRNIGVARGLDGLEKPLPSLASLLELVPTCASALGLCFLFLGRRKHRPSALGTILEPLEVDCVASVMSAPNWTLCGLGPESSVAATFQLTNTIYNQQSFLVIDEEKQTKTGSK